MSSLFWSSNFISLTQAFHFVKKFFQPLFKHSCVLRWFLSGNSIRIPQTRHPVKHFFLPIIAFHSFDVRALVECLNRIHLFRHKVNTFFAFICVFLCNYTVFSYFIHKTSSSAHKCKRACLYYDWISRFFSNMLAATNSAASQAMHITRNIAYCPASISAFWLEFIPTCISEYGHHNPCPLLAITVPQIPPNKAINTGTAKLRISMDKIICAAMTANPPITPRSRKISVSIGGSPEKCANTFPQKMYSAKVNACVSNTILTITRNFARKISIRWTGAETSKFQLCPRCSNLHKYAA